MGLYGFSAILPTYRDSLPREVATIRRQTHLYTLDERRLQEQDLYARHAQWEAILYPSFLLALGIGMAVSGAGALIYLRDRRPAPNADSD